MKYMLLLWDTYLYSSVVVSGVMGEEKTRSIPQFLKVKGLNCSLFFLMLYIGQNTADNSDYASVE